MSENPGEPGWRPDPYGQGSKGRYRWHDGTDWTRSVADRPDHPAPNNSSQSATAPATRADRRATQGEPAKPPQPAKPVDPNQSLWPAYIVLGVIAVLIVVGFRACTSGSGEDNTALASRLNAVINEWGEYGFASYGQYEGVRVDSGNDMAIRTSLYDKPENEQVARNMCGSMMSIRLQDGLEDLGHVRILSSAGTTLAYCD